MKFFTVAFYCVLIVVSYVSAEACEMNLPCPSCLKDDNCVYVLGTLIGETDSKYMCTNDTATRSLVTVLAKFRRQEDCSLAVDVELKGEDFLDEKDDDTPEMLSSLDKCPMASPLLIAFFISSILLAISVSVMCTLFWWPSKDDNAEASVQQNKGKAEERRRRKPEEQLEDAV